MIWLCLFLWLSGALIFAGAIHEDGKSEWLAFLSGLLYPLWAVLGAAQWACEKIGE